MPVLRTDPPCRTWLEVSQAALRHNVQALRSHAGGAEVLAVVKANAYGLGIDLLAPVLAREGVRFAVASVTEARELRGHVADAEVLLLGPLLPWEVQDAVALDCIVTVSSESELAPLAAAGRARVHLEIDTGMGRIGALPEDFPRIIQAVREAPNLSLHSVSTHLPSADEDGPFTMRQLARFAELIASVELPPETRIHVLNSAGVLRFPEEARRMIRPGLALYGVSPIASRPGLLAAVAAWKARVVLTRQLPAGHGISYGRAHVTDRQTPTAVLSVGYADGYPRQVSLKGAYVLLRGRRCPVLGRVTMDQLIVDVTQPGRVEVGDVATLIGRDGEEALTVSQLADWADTIPWHILTGIGRRVRRIAVE